MISQTDLSGKFAYDTKGLDQLRTSSRQDSQEALKGTAQQFEALFLNMVMKSMRDATPHESPFSSEQEKMMTGMLDQQLSQTMAKRGIGLADTLVLQLSKTMGQKPGADAAKGAPDGVGAANSAAAISSATTPAISSAAKPGAASATASATASAISAGLEARSVKTVNAAYASNFNSNAVGNNAANSAGNSTANTVNNPGASQQSRIAQLADELAKMNGESGPRPFLPGRLGNQAALYLDNKNLDRVARQGPEAGRLNNADYDALAAVSGRKQSDHVRAFQQNLGHHAEAASRETGIPAKFMLGQAALESGWGKREIIASDGSKSHNLFGIKASGGWKGKTTEATTIEYVNGVPMSRREKFRVYDSYAEGFRDYAKLLSKNPRYENVINNSQDASSFAKGLQRAGYATDPHYATKLTKIINQNLI